MPDPIAVIFQINGNRGKNSGNSEKFNIAQFKRKVTSCSKEGDASRAAASYF
jgi:hypothetical protein